MKAKKTFVKFNQTELRSMNCFFVQDENQNEMRVKTAIKVNNSQIPVYGFLLAIPYTPNCLKSVRTIESREQEKTRFCPNFKFSEVLPPLAGTLGASLAFLYVFSFFSSFSLTNIKFS